MVNFNLSINISTISTLLAFTAKNKAFLPLSFLAFGLCALGDYIADEYEFQKYETFLILRTNMTFVRIDEMGDAIPISDRVRSKLPNNKILDWWESLK